MNDIDEKKFISYLHNGKFNKAKELVKNIEFDDLNDFLLKESFEVKETFEGRSLQPYAYLVFCLLFKETAELHSAASVIMSTALCHYEGAFSVGLLHARRAVVLEPKNVSHQVWLLSFWRVPDKVMSDEEALSIVQNILLKDPTNQTALQTLEDIKWFQSKKQNDN